MRCHRRKPQRPIDAAPSRLPPSNHPRWGPPHRGKRLPGRALQQFSLNGASVDAASWAPELGIAVEPEILRALQVNRAAERVRLGLRPDLLTGLVLFGGEGSAEMVRFAQALNRAGSRVQLILLCGKNAGVISQLRAWIGGFRSGSRASRARFRSIWNCPTFSSASRARAASARRWSSACR